MSEFAALIERDQIQIASLSKTPIRAFPQGAPVYSTTPYTLFSQERVLRGTLQLSQTITPQMALESEFILIWQIEHVDRKTVGEELWLLGVDAKASLQTFLGAARYKEYWGAFQRDQEALRLQLENEAYKAV